MTILETFKNTVKNFKRLDGEIGLEIETETKAAYDAPKLYFWDIHNDGSLRDFGVEYVLKQPLKHKDELDKALKEFEEKTSGIKFIKDSISTSVHIHLNILNESFRTLGNFFTYYALFENLLVEFSGPDRLSNLFCLPMKDAEETVFNIRTMFQGFERKNYGKAMFQENGVKYAALNLSSIYRYGSVEVRTFRGETDIKTIKQWVDIVYAIMVAARKDIDPKGIMDAWKTRGTGLVDDVFGEHAKLLKTEKMEAKVKGNLFYAATIAYSVKDWAALDIVEKPYVPTAKDIAKFAAVIFAVPPERLSPAQYDYLIEHIRKQHTAGKLNKKKSMYDEPIARVRHDEDDIEADF